MSKTESTNNLSREHEIGKKLYDLVITKVSDEHGVRAETAIASASRMAGMYLLLSFGFNLEKAKAGQLVLSEEANEQGPELIQIASRVLGALDTQINTDDLGKEIPEENKPRISVLESEERLTASFEEVAKETHADNKTMARAGAITTGMLIANTEAVLDPTIGFLIAAYGFIEGAKTAPLKVS